MTGYFLKELFYSINFIIVLCGLTALGVGVWIHVDAENFAWIAGIQAFSVANAEMCGLVLMACGAAVVLFAALGVIGVKYDIVCLMAFYLVLLVVVVGVQLVAAILGAFLKQEVEQLFEKVLIDHIQYNYTGPRGKDLFTETFNLFMTDMKCCGVRNATSDFVYPIQAWNRTRPDGSAHLVPSQCCKPSYGCETSPDDINANLAGCLDVVKDAMFKYHTLIIVVSSVIIGLQLLLVVLDVSLIGNRRRK